MTNPLYPGINGGEPPSVKLLGQQSESSLPAYFCFSSHSTDFTRKASEQL